MEANNRSTTLIIAAILLTVGVAYISLSSTPEGVLVLSKSEPSDAAPLENSAVNIPVPADERIGDQSVKEVVNSKRNIEKENIFCFSRADHIPLSGVVMFRGGRVRAAGPSAHTGELLLDNLGSKTKRTFWAPGWQAKHFAIDAKLPDEITLSKADANLVVRIIGMKPEWRIAKSKLQITGVPSGGNEAWMPILRRDLFDLLRADRIPAGTYDIYIWVSQKGGQPQALHSKAVEVKAGETTTIQVFATGDWPDEH